MKKSGKHEGRIEVIFFDMDGVVLNSMPYHVMAWQEAFGEFGLDVPSQLFYLYEGAIEPQNAVDLFSQNGCRLSVKDFSVIFRRQREIFKERFEKKVRPFPEIPQILSQLYEMGIKTALVTSSHKDILAGILPQWLISRFECIVTGDAVKHRKPHPAPYLKAVDHFQALPNRCVAIENAPAGIESAKRAGLMCIAIETTLTKDHLHMADAIVKDHKELLHAVDI